MKILATVAVVISTIAIIVYSRYKAKKRDESFLGVHSNGYIFKKTSSAAADAFSALILTLSVSLMPQLINIEGAILIVFYVFFLGIALCLLIYTLWLIKWRVVVEDDTLVFHTLFRSPRQINLDDIYLVKEVIRSRVTIATRAWAFRRTYKAYIIYANRKKIVTIDESVLNLNQLICHFNTLGIIE